MSATLPVKLLEIHRSLGRSDIPHAFGGAIALAYWTLDPRGTSDIDVNVFVAAASCESALAALPGDVAQPEGTVERIKRDGQSRLWWDLTPVDLFFDYHPLHATASRNSRMVPFANAEIPILGPVELTVFKTMFDRTRDWADIEAMIAADSVDLDAVRAALRELVDGADHRIARLDEATARATAAL